MKKGRELKHSTAIEKKYRDALNVRVKWLADREAGLIRELKANEPSYQADAPAVDLRSKINEIKKAYKKRFTADMTRRLAQRMFALTNAFNVQSFKQSVSPLGIDVEDVLRRDNLKDFTSVAIQNNVNLITNMADDHLDKIESVVFNGMQNGTDWNVLAQKIVEISGATENRAKLIARDQVSTINSQLAKRRMTNAGITKGRWVKTKRVKNKTYTPRKSHLEANGKEFDLSKGLYLDGEYTFPGEPINCTCTFVPVID